MSKNTPEISRFFFNVLSTNHTFETDNEALAWQKFNECYTECELFDNGNMIAEKFWEENENEYGEPDGFILVQEIYTGNDYVELEMADV